MTRTLILLAIIGVFSVAQSASAGPLEDGKTAYDRRDYANAFQLWVPLAEQGNVSAQNNIGWMYQNGLGVPQNYSKALEWYRLAAQKGVASAQDNIGFMYENGFGVPQDYDEALRWYGLAAQKGHANAQNNIGMMYWYGRGVPRNFVSAYMWFNISVSSSKGQDKEIIKNRSDVLKNMTTGQVAQAQAMTKECIETNYRNCGLDISVEKPTSTANVLISIPMKREAGIYVVPVLINGAITLDFIVDSGAADVSIPADVVTTLMRTGTIRESDFLGQKTYVLADGSKVPSQTFRIRSLKVGNKVLENVNGSVASVQGSLLLGQSFLSHFKSWSVDNTTHALLLSD